MNVLLIYPIFPPSFWSFDEAIRLVGLKALLPPLGLVTVAAMLPQEWSVKLVDRNVRDITEEEWAWADIVMLSAMIVQKRDFHEQIAEAHRRGKRVVVGGPYPTALPQECGDADYLVLDEGEITVPLFLQALARGETSGTFRSDGVKPDVTLTPIPRFELLEMEAYSEMAVQFSRGCPFLCEFCDIIVLYGRKPRTKLPSQMLAELQRLYDLGWRRSVFMVDDNFIGNKKNVKALLEELQPWMAERNYPFTFATEASVDLAQDQDLMNQMVACNFRAVFLGIETPDAESLVLTRKTQNNRDPLTTSIERIARSGLRIMAGFIIGFDNEQRGAGQRIVQFVEQTAIPTATFSMLQALPDTALSKRLATEGRLIENRGGDINQTTLMNYHPTRPMEQIAREYVDGFWDLYDPVRYLERTFQHYMMLKDGQLPRRRGSARRRISRGNGKALIKVIWRQGVRRSSRWKFWPRLYQMLRHNRRRVGSYISTLAQYEHFHVYRQLVRREIEAQLKHHADHPVPPPGGAAGASGIGIASTSGRIQLPVHSAAVGSCTES
jgi:radical SAM superfamily enzyme YgiQ (UPF0313 family)